MVAAAGLQLHADGSGDLVRIDIGGEPGEAKSLLGRVLVEARDGGLLVETRDRQLWTVTPDQLRRREATDDDFRPMDAEELGRSLLDELGPGFEIVTTRHYVICTNAGRKYAEWCGGLFERLLEAFLTHWRARPLRLQEPESPLVAIVFASQPQFAEFAARDAGAASAGAIGYYSTRTNRIVLYDLTAGPDAAPVRTAAEINRKLAAAPLNVATVVHEATHQIAFNCGLHTRYADNPLWLTEGMAMYFETPDLESRAGWRTVGRPNTARLAQLEDYIRRRRPADSLVKLVSSDARFTQAETAADAYAEAWGLSYFLIKTRRREYLEYLDRLSQKRRLLWDRPEERLAEFEAAFGDAGTLDRQFVAYVARLGR
jgi:hypothetical protein